MTLAVYLSRLIGLRVLLALMVVGVCAKLAFDLVATPVDLYSVDFDAGY